MKVMRLFWICALVFSIASPPLYGKKLSEKFKERPTKDTFLDKNKDGINDYFESKEIGRSFLKGILEGINKVKERKSEDYRKKLKKKSSRKSSKGTRKSKTRRK